MQARATIRKHSQSTGHDVGGPKPGVFFARCLLSFLRLFGFSIRAMADVRDQVYSLGLATQNIYQVVYPNGTVNAVFTNYPGGGAASAAGAQRASDGVIFYIGNFGNANQPVFTWNPATPATAPVQIGTTGTGIPYIPRLAFSANGVLYAMDTNSTNLYTIDQATGAATSVGTVTGIPTNLGGDIGFGPDGILYVVAGTTIYTVPLTGGAVSHLGTNTQLARTASIHGITL